MARRKAQEIKHVPLGLKLKPAVIDKKKRASFLRRAGLAAGLLGAVAGVLATRGGEKKPVLPTPEAIRHAEEEPPREGVPPPQEPKPSVRLVREPEGSALEPETAPARPSKERTATGLVYFPLTVQVDGKPQRVHTLDELKKTIHRQVNRHASELGLEPALVLAHLRQESDYNPFALGSAGERGLLQLKPQVIRDLHRLSARYGLGVTPEYFDPENADHYSDLSKNVRAGAAYIKVLREHYLAAAKGAPAKPDEALRTRLGMALYQAGPRESWAEAQKLARERPYAGRVWQHYERARRESR